jgi:hypothetical protein
MRAIPRYALAILLLFLLVPCVVLAGAYGYFLVSCTDWHRSFGWSLLFTVALPALYPIIMLPWGILLLGAFFGLRPARSWRFLGQIALASLAALPVCFALGSLMAWVFGTTDDCILKLW